MEEIREESDQQQENSEEEDKDSEEEEEEEGQGGEEQGAQRGAQGLPCAMLTRYAASQGQSLLCCICSVVKCMSSSAL